MDDNGSDNNDMHEVDRDDDSEMMAAAVLVVVNNNIAIMNMMMLARQEQEDQDRMRMINNVMMPNQDYRRQPRQAKALFRHDEAVWCIQRDFLGIPGDLTTPIFKDSSFEMFFRLSRTRVQRIFEDVMHADLPFYAYQVDATGRNGASLESKILLPLKTLAYGTAEHAFSDYFQMSKALASKCCEEFANMMRCIYSEEYLRIPDANDLKSITRLHHEVHGVRGMFGSLDCMHTRWKNCPKAWQQSFKSGKESGGPTVVLEALSDYHLWFWHASFGYAGSLNDLNILNLSPLLESLVDGTFRTLEETANLIPFEVDGEAFNRLYALVDGIYPPYSRFVKGIQVPVSASEKTFTAWQEAARKDIERAFGVLQCRFQVMSRPFHAHSLVKMSNTVSACLIMHNMCVSDRVMDGNVYAVYDPSHNNFEEQLTIGDVFVAIANENSEYHRRQQQEEEAATENYYEAMVQARIGLANGGNEFVVQHILARQANWKELNDRFEHGRLHAALKRLKGQAYD